VFHEGCGLGGYDWLIWGDPISLHGSFNVDGTRLLLDACAEILETLWLHPDDSHGKEDTHALSDITSRILTVIYRGTSRFGRSR
jgi:hypothetical protein